MLGSTHREAWRRRALETKRLPVPLLAGYLTATCVASACGRSAEKQPEEPGPEERPLDAAIEGATAKDGASEPASDAEQDGPDRALQDAELEAGPADAGELDASDARPAIAGTLPLSGDLGVHDPSIIQADGEYLIFSTGPGIPLKRSADLMAWRDAGNVFSQNPTWLRAQVPDATDLWAPDIAFFGGLYHLYYSASSFGSNQSCIGHATAEGLASIDFVDRGPVICSRRSDDWNAIDPDVIVDELGQPWLALGSFWSGIKLIPLEPTGARAGTELYSLASRGGGAIEAPYILHRQGYYYLFVSFDNCCQGEASTYRIMVGRSDRVLGPYLDQQGVPLLSGGGTELVAGDERWRGPGHNSALVAEDTVYLVYHAYDSQREGAPTLRIGALQWNAAGWPLSGSP